jgi:hypothetical protein
MLVTVKSQSTKLFSHFRFLPFVAEAWRCNDHNPVGCRSIHDNRTDHILVRDRNWRARIRRGPNPLQRQHGLRPALVIPEKQ